MVDEDQAPPTIKITSPQNKEYQNDKILKIKYTVTDNVTNPSEIETAVIYDNQPLTKKEIDLLLEHLGKHDLKITAQDEADNSTEKEVSFSVATSPHSMISNVKHYRKLKLIKNSRTASILKRRLENIQRIDKVWQRLEKRWFPQWWRKRINRYFQFQENRQIKSLIRLITRSHYFKRNITPKVRTILVEDLKNLEH